MDVQGTKCPDIFTETNPKKAHMRPHPPNERLCYLSTRQDRDDCDRVIIY